MYAKFVEQAGSILPVAGLEAHVMHALVFSYGQVNLGRHLPDQSCVIFCKGRVTQ